MSLNSQIIDKYENSVLSNVEDNERRSAMLRNAKEASADGALYGPFEGSDGVAAMYLNNTAAAYEDGELPPALADLTASQAAEAIDVVTSNMVRTGADYMESRKDVDLMALNNTRRDLMEGIIKPGGASFLPDALAMTTHEGIAQVMHADTRFGALSSYEQLLIADVNYRGWTSNVMTTGDDMLQGSASLRDKQKQTELKRMKEENAKIRESKSRQR